MIFRYELKKLLRFPLLWALLISCAALNILGVTGEFDFSRQGVKIINSYVETGEKPAGDEFGFCEDYDYAAGYSFDKYYEGFNIYDELHRLEDGMGFGFSEAAQKVIDRNYEKLQERVEEIASSGEGRDSYYPGLSFAMHHRLYGTVLLLALIECCVCGVLLTSYLMKYEEAFHTEQLVYSSGRGRSTVFVKGLAAGAVTAGLSIIILLVTVVFFLIYVPQPIEFLRSSVSAAMATEQRSVLTYPFITWIKMSQLGYLAAVCGTIVVYALLASFITFAFSFVSKNAYVGALLPAAFYIGIFAQWYAAPTDDLSVFVRLFNPSVAMLNIDGWFMEFLLSPQISYPGFEIWVAAGWTAMCALASAALWKRFRKSDI